MRVRKRRISYGENQRQYRKDKIHPQRGSATISADFGTWQKDTEIVFPEEAQIIEHFHDKTPNPDIITFRLGTCYLKIYKSTGKGFVYDSKGCYAGTFEWHDLQRLFGVIGAEIKKNCHCKRIQYCNRQKELWRAKRERKYRVELNAEK